MEAMLDTLPCGVLSFTDDGTVLMLNGTLARMLGYERGEIEGHHVEALLTIAGRIFFQTHLYPLVRLQGRASELFVLMRRKDGGDVGALFNAVRHERDGRAVVDCAVLEIQERRKYEDALLRAKRDAESANRALAERTRDVEEANNRLEEQAVELELQQQQLQDQTTELEAQSEELRSVNDRLRARTEELEHAKQVAEEANRAKSQFLAVMSHELRTPLNAIGGYAQLLELGVHGPVTDAQRDVLARITRAQGHLLRLINEVLNLARIEAGHVDYKLENLVVADVISAVMPMIEPQMQAAKLTSSATVPTDLVMHADREKVQQILINLLTNAVKFTLPGGSIRVDASAQPDSGRVAIDVTDTGIGIPPTKLASVFEPFVQVDVSDARRQLGSGLGLAISRDLARGMGGDLVARSDEGRGSTFTLLVRQAR